MGEPVPRIASLLSQSEIPYLVVRDDGVPLEWNSSAETLFPELERKNFFDRIAESLSADDAERFRRLVGALATGIAFEFPIRAGTEDRRWFKLIMSRLTGGSYLALLDNVTDQKQKEQLLSDARVSAEKASVSRSQFLANISHEIRTPIQTIIGMMELLDETKLDDEQTEYVRQVKFSADVMLTLINDVLDFSKVEAGQLKIESIGFDLSDVIERSVDLVSMEAHKKGLEICVDISPELPALATGDPGRLQQVILNLVKNAVKFTAKGHILVRANPLRDGAKGQNFVHFEVTDTGIGIKDEVKARLFTQFFQADASTTRKYGGTGLGLAISRNIVELVGGAIGVRNNEDAGATFWFDIPLPPAAAQPISEAIPLSPKARFLIVDDNALTMTLLCGMLGSLGYTDVTGATSGKAALEALRSARSATKPFDIVLIDMIMPEMDGWRLAAEINKNRDINQAQLYLMVPEGSFGADAKMKLLEWFNGYLYKPIKRRKLAELLREHWQSSIDLEIVEELESPDAEPVPARAAQTDTPAEGYTILIAEDHPVNRKLLKIILEKAGATVITAEDGQEATARMATEAIDLVFMDIQMPRLNGYEATVWIRERGYGVPIIACTASAQENEKEQCLRVGMTDILPKPYKKQDVIDIMGKYLGKKESDTKEPGADTDEGRNATGRDIFDSQAFFDIMMGDTDAARSLLGEFLEQTDAHLTILEEDIRAGLREDASKTAHLIKGSALNVTASTLAEAARVVEKNAATHTPDRLLEALDRMKVELEALRIQIAKEGYA